MTEQKIWSSLHPFYEQGAMLGRIEANRCFIRALFELDPFDAYHFFLPLPADCDALEASLRENFPDLWKEGRFQLRLHRDLPHALRIHSYYCMHLSDPFSRYTEAMCMRNAFSRRIFPLTATTHSLSYAEYGQSFLQHIWGGVTGRDSIVATSSAGREVVENYYKTLGRGYGLDGKVFFSPRVSHIPLGVEPGDMPSPENKTVLGAAARHRHGLGDETVFLIFARISYQSKMDILPVLRAFKRAEALGLDPDGYSLVLAGWVDDEDTFAGQIKNLCANLGINCVIVPRPDHETRKGLYAAADVFLSPSDNLQETFGLTMLEAAISGLPVIASNFDGYKDLAEHEKTGILVSCTGPDATPCTDILRAITPDAEYHLLLAQQCAVDVQEMGEAIFRLSAHPELGRKMGEAGRSRVLAACTWHQVVKKYMALWEELGETPCDLSENPQERPEHSVFHPAYPRYMDIFGSYYTRRLEEFAASGVKLRWSRAGEAVYRGVDYPVVYRLIEEWVNLDQLKKMLFSARKPVELACLRKDARMRTLPLPDSDPDFLLLWAIKHDYLEIV